MLVKLFVTFLILFRVASAQYAFTTLKQPANMQEPRGMSINNAGVILLNYTPKNGGIRRSVKIQHGGIIAIKTPWPTDLISRLCATFREFCSPFETAWVATLSEARRGLEKAHGSHTTLTVASMRRP